MLHERFSPVVTTVRSVSFIAPASVIDERDHATGLSGKDPLTTREIELLEHLASGACNRSLAKHLSISVATVRTHLRNINVKLQARNRMHAVTLAYQAGFIKNPGQAGIADPADVAVPGRSVPVVADSESGDHALTGREILLIQKLSEGLSNEELAAALFMSVSTVRARLRSLYRKLDVENRTQAVALARRLGILTRAPAAQPAGDPTPRAIHHPLFSTAWNRT